MRSALLTATLALALLAACGQKGPLYLPDESGNVVVRPAAESGPAAAPASAPAPGTEDADAKAKKQPPEAA